MISFLAKHKKIIFFGVIVAAIFSIIISLSSKRSGTPIKLTQFITRENTDTATTSTVPQAQPTTTPTATQPSPFGGSPTTPPTYPDILITFVIGSGFTPSSKNVFVGQKVVWRNDTDANIQIEDIFPKHSALANGVTVAPGQTTEIILTSADSGLFTYRELNSGITARLFVGK